MKIIEVSDKQYTILSYIFIKSKFVKNPMAKKILYLTKNPGAPTSRKKGLGKTNERN